MLAIESRWLTPQGAAVYASVSLRMMWRWIAEGRVTVHRPSQRKVLIDRAELDRMIADSAERKSAS